MTQSSNDFMLLENKFETRNIHKLRKGQTMQTQLGLSKTKPALTELVY